MDHQINKLRRRAAETGAVEDVAAFGAAMLRSQPAAAVAAVSGGPVPADAFTACDNKGVKLNFRNGWAISVQWGPGNYTDCEGGRFGDFERPRRQSQWTASSAEIAVFVPEGRQDRRFLHLQNDEVAGWVSAEQVAEIAGAVSAFSSDRSNASAQALICSILSRPEPEPDEGDIVLNAEDSPVSDPVSLVTTNLSLNNSGGRDWITLEHVAELERMGWERGDGAGGQGIPYSMTRSLPEWEARDEFTAVTGFTGSEVGCECCGPPFFFSDYN